MEIRQASTDDFEAIWPIFRSIVQAGETYGFDPMTSKEQAFDLWMSQPAQTFVASNEDEVLGSYYITRNHDGPGAHVCNCGYMVSPSARGQGLATLMCEHSQQHALTLGYKAMQFNFVASSNSGAVRLWEKLEFKKVGTLPAAFNHPSQGLVDAYIFYKWLNAN